MALARCFTIDSGSVALCGALWCSVALCCPQSFRLNVFWSTLALFALSLESVAMHIMWCRSLDCHNVALLLAHLRPWIILGKDVANHIASFLKLLKLGIVACTEARAHTRYAFWNDSGWSLEFCNDTLPLVMIRRLS